MSTLNLSHSESPGNIAITWQSTNNNYGLNFVSPWYNSCWTTWSDFSATAMTRRILWPRCCTRDTTCRCNNYCQENKYLVDNWVADLFKHVAVALLLLLGRSGCDKQAQTDAAWVAAVTEVINNKESVVCMQVCRLFILCCTFCPSTDAGGMLCVKRKINNLHLWHGVHNLVGKRSVQERHQSVDVSAKLCAACGSLRAAVTPSHNAQGCCLPDGCNSMRYVSRVSCKLKLSFLCVESFNSPKRCWNGIK